MAYTKKYNLTWHKWQYIEIKKNYMEIKFSRIMPYNFFNWKQFHTYNVLKTEKNFKLNLPDTNTKKNTKVPVIHTPKP